MSWTDMQGTRISSPRREAPTETEERRLLTTVMVALHSQGWSYLKISRHLRYSDKHIAKRIERANHGIVRLCG